MKERKTKRQKADYRTTYLKSSGIKARDGKMIYLDNGFHKKIQIIINFIADEKMSIFDYVHNVMAEHFRQQDDEIRKLYEETQKPIL